MGNRSAKQPVLSSEEKELLSSLTPLSWLCPYGVVHQARKYKYGPSYACLGERQGPVVFIAQTESQWDTTNQSTRLLNYFVNGFSGIQSYLGKELALDIDGVDYETYGETDPLTISIPCHVPNDAPQVQQFESYIQGASSKLVNLYLANGKREALSPKSLSRCEVLEFKLNPWGNLPLDMKLGDLDEFRYSCELLVQPEFQPIEDTDSILDSSISGGATSSKAMKLAGPKLGFTEVNYQLGKYQVQNFIDDTKHLVNREVMPNAPVISRVHENNSCLCVDVHWKCPHGHTHQLETSIDFTVQLPPYPSPDSTNPPHASDRNHFYFHFPDRTWRSAGWCYDRETVSIMDSFSPYTLLLRTMKILLLQKMSLAGGPPQSDFQYIDEKFLEMRKASGTCMRSRVQFELEDWTLPEVYAYMFNVLLETAPEYYSKK